MVQYNLSKHVAKSVLIWVISLEEQKDVLIILVKTLVNGEHNIPKEYRNNMIREEINDVENAHNRSIHKAGN